MYADDTVLLFSDKTEAEINKAINHDANLLHMTYIVNIQLNCFSVNVRTSNTQRHGKDADSHETFQVYKQ